MAGSAFTDGFSRPCQATKVHNRACGVTEVHGVHQTAASPLSRPHFLHEYQI